MKKKIDKINIANILPFILVIVIIFLSASLLKIFITRYHSFNIKRVVISGADDTYAEIGRRLIGRNIFSLNLRTLENEIQEQAADIDCISIRRNFPNEIAISLKKRIVIGQLKLSRFYPVDDSGMIIGSPSDLALEGLPVIIGLDNKLSKPKIARVYSNQYLAQAIELIKAKNNAVNLNGYKLTKVNFSKPQEPSFFIVDNFNQGNVLKDTVFKPKYEVEIKFNPQEALETIKVFGLLLDKRNGSLENIEYIDLKNLNSPVFMEKKDKPA